VAGNSMRHDVTSRWPMAGPIEPSDPVIVAGRACEAGSAGGDVHAMQVLFQLSYSPTGSLPYARRLVTSRVEN